MLEDRPQELDEDPKEIIRLDIKIKAAVINSANEMCSLLQEDLTMESSSFFKKRMDNILTCYCNIAGTNGSC
jgi:hypothetical protein